MNFLKNKKFIFLILIFLPEIIFALELEISWPPSPFGTTLTEESGLVDLARYLYDWILFLGGIAALIALIIGGFRYMTSTGNPTALADAKDRITSALIGLALLLGSWLILRTINPEYVLLTAPTFTPTSTLIEGVPTSTLNLAPCHHVIIYENTNYATTGKYISIDVGKSSDFDFQPGSVKIVDSSGNFCKEATPACGCIVKFHTATSCDDAVQWTAGPYSDPDLTKLSLPELRCAEVEGVSF